MKNPFDKPEPLRRPHAGDRVVIGGVPYIVAAVGACERHARRDAKRLSLPWTYDAVRGYYLVLRHADTFAPPAAPPTTPAPTDDAAAVPS